MPSLNRQVFHFLLSFSNLSTNFKQITRTPTPFPTLKITKQTSIPSRLASGASQDDIVEEALALLESFEFADFEVDGYKPHAKIAMKMSV